jgi:hypothetical protein
MMATHGLYPGKNIIVIPDDKAEALLAKVRPDMVESVGPGMVIMSNDSIRVYIRASTWKAMQESWALTRD